MADTLEARHVSISDTSVDSSPLIASSGESRNDSNVHQRPSAIRRGVLSRVFNLIRRRSGDRLGREPSILVRETAAEQFEERQSEWAYSKPVVILDLMWNLIFVSISGVVLLMSLQERPSNPLRIWILGYAAQCCIHVSCVLFEYRRRHRDVRNRHDPETPSYTSNEGEFYPERYDVEDDDFDDGDAGASRIRKVLQSRRSTCCQSLSFDALEPSVKQAVDQASVEES